MAPRHVRVLRLVLGRPPPGPRRTRCSSRPRAPYAWWTPSPARTSSVASWRTCGCSNRRAGRRRGTIYRQALGLAGQHPPRDEGRHRRRRETGNPRVSRGVRMGAGRRGRVRRPLRVRIFSSGHLAGVRSSDCHSRRYGQDIRSVPSTLAMLMQPNGPVPPAERPVERPPVAAPGPAGKSRSSTSSGTPTSRSPRQIYLAARLPDRVGAPSAGHPPAAGTELGAAPAVNPNTVRAVYRRLADAGYVVAARGGDARRGPAAGQAAARRPLAGIVAETLRRAAQLGFTPDEVAQAIFTGGHGREASGPHIACCSRSARTADAKRGRGADLGGVSERVEVIPVLLDELPERLDRYHYDLVATTTFHADEAQAYVAGRVPVVAMLVGPGYMSLIHEITGLPPGSRRGRRLRIPAGRGEHRRGAPARGRLGRRDRLGRRPDGARSSSRSNREADLVLMSREAMALGLEARFDRPERLREWTLRVRPGRLRAAAPRDRARRRVDRGMPATSSTVCCHRC